MIMPWNSPGKWFIHPTFVKLAVAEKSEWNWGKQTVQLEERAYENKKTMNMIIYYYGVGLDYDMAL